MNPLLNVSEVAKETGMCQASIYRRLASGELKSIKIGRALRVRRSDLEAFLRANEREAAPDVHELMQGRRGA